MNERRFEELINTIERALKSWILTKEQAEKLKKTINPYIIISKEYLNQGENK